MQIKNKKKFIIIYLLSFFLFNLNLNAEEFNIATISCVEYDATIYSNQQIGGGGTDKLPGFEAPPAPTSLAFNVKSVIENGYGILTYDSTYFNDSSQYQIEYKLASDTSWTRLGETVKKEFKVFNLRKDTYDFRVRINDYLNLSPTSDWAYLNNIDISANWTLPEVTGVTGNFATQDAIFTWDDMLDVDIQNQTDPNDPSAVSSGKVRDVFKYYRVQIKHGSDPSVVRTEYVSTNKFIYEFDDNNSDGLSRTISIDVTIIDIENIASGLTTGSSTSVTNPQMPKASGLGYQGDRFQSLLSWSDPSLIQPDYAITTIQTSTSENGTYTVLDKVKGSQYFIVNPPGNEQWVKIAHSDIFGEDGQIYSDPIDVTVPAADPVTNIDFKQLDTSDTKARGELSWTNPSDTTVPRMIIEQRVHPSGSYTQVGVSSSSIFTLEELDVGTTYQWRILVADGKLADSAYAESSPYTIVSPHTSVPPVTGVNVDFEEKRDATIVWNDMAETNLVNPSGGNTKVKHIFSHYEIEVSHDNNVWFTYSSATPEFTYTYEMNRNNALDEGEDPSRTIYAKVYIVSNLGTRSSLGASGVSVDNDTNIQMPALQNIQLIDGSTSMQSLVTWDLPDELDYYQVIVYASDTQNGTYTEIDRVANSSGWTRVWENQDPKWLKFAAIDVYGDSPSPTLSSALEKNIPGPDAPTGLTVTLVDYSQNLGATVELNWTDPNQSIFSKFEIEYKLPGTSSFIKHNTVSQTTTRIPGLLLDPVAHQFRVRTVNDFSGVSSYTTVSSVINKTMATVPVPTNAAIEWGDSGNSSTAIVSWDDMLGVEYENGTVQDVFKYYEIFINSNTVPSNGAGAKVYRSTTQRFEYTIDKNKEDDIGRDVNARVRLVTVLGTSALSSNVQASNDQIVTPSPAPTASVNLSTVTFNYTIPEINDYAATIFFARQSLSSSWQEIGRSNGGSFTWAASSLGLWYYSMAHIDTFDEEDFTLSSTGTFTAVGVDLPEVPDDLTTIRDPDNSVTTTGEHVLSVASPDERNVAGIGFIANNSGRSDIIVAADRFMVAGGGHAEYDDTKTYTINNRVFVTIDESTTRLYRALTSVPIGKPPATNPAYWTLVNSNVNQTILSVDATTNNGSVIISNAIIKNLSATNLAADAVTGDKINATTKISVGQRNSNSSLTLNGSTITDSGWRLWAGHASVGSAPFKVSQSGAVYATDAHITGEINATSGTITNTLTVKGTLDMRNGTAADNTLAFIGLGAATGSGSRAVGIKGLLNGQSTSGTAAFWAGTSTISTDAPFQVRHNGDVKVRNAVIDGDFTTTGSGNIQGKITATSGNFTGQVWVGAVDSGAAISGTGDWRFWSGTATSAGAAQFRVHKDGSLYATNATITGQINGTSGSMTNISAKRITVIDGAGNNAWIKVGAQDVDASASNSTYGGGIDGSEAQESTGSYDNIIFWAGKEITHKASAPFRVTQLGTVYAANANITGVINATSGVFDNVNIRNSCSVTNTLSVGNNCRIYGGSGTGTTARIWAGATTSSSAKFIVYDNGSVVCNRVNAYEYLIAGGDNTKNAGMAGTSSSDTAIAIWAGSNRPSTSSPFYVRNDGYFKATNAEITGDIYASTGRISGSMYVGSGTGVGLTGSGTSNSSVRIWAGSTTSASAPFRVTKDGTVHCNRIVSDIVGADANSTVTTAVNKGLTGPGTYTRIVTFTVANNTTGTGYATIQPVAFKIVGTPESGESGDHASLYVRVGDGSSWRTNEYKVYINNSAKDFHIMSPAWTKTLSAGGSSSLRVEAFLKYGSDLESSSTYAVCNQSHATAQFYKAGGAFS